MSINVMNLADPQLELIDPTPNVHALFMHFDRVFFWTKLASRAVVRWSKRMYSCAGICSYDRGGLCDIALSEPLLKLRPRKDLVETLLHEMIHAFLFVTNRDQNRDGHGPNFQAHMHRINKSAGLNISIYHSFHDEVQLYQTHWWRCNGPCQKLRPHFGIVRRPMNKAPGPHDNWWNYHQRMCGGTFIKIKEPEKKIVSKKSAANKINTNADITKYITNKTKKINTPSGTNKPVLKKSNTNTSGISSLNSLGTSIKSINDNTVKNTSQSVTAFTGNGYTINTHITDSRSVTEHVRNIWANKQIPTVNSKLPSSSSKLESGIFENNKPVKKPDKIAGISKTSKHKIETNNIQSPAKIKKIDDYFKVNSSVLNNTHEKDIKGAKPFNSPKLVQKELVECPVCCNKMDSKEINRHLDECLNKEVIKELSQGDQTVQIVNSSQSKIDEKKQIEDLGSPTNCVKPSDQNTFVIDDFFEFDTKDKEIENNGKRKNDLQTLDVNQTTKKVYSENNNTIKEPNCNNNVKNSADTFVNIHASGDVDITEIKTEPGTSKDSKAVSQICPCCANRFNNTMEEHLDECLVFFNNDTTIPEETPSTSLGNISTIVIEDDDDDIFDDSQVYNATGTKAPCPCCMKMIEEAAMNDHLDICLESQP